jgi:6-phosphogluconate dehydrogenase
MPPGARLAATIEIGRRAALGALSQLLERTRARFAFVAARRTRHTRSTGRRRAMQLGMIGLGRMGGNMAKRLLAAGHDCVVHDRHPENVTPLTKLGARSAKSLAALVQMLEAPRAVWLMIPAAGVDAAVDALAPELSPGDVIVDGGNSHYVDDQRRAAALRGRAVDYVDVGVSGGVWGLDSGYCLMIGGDRASFERLRPIFAALSPGGAAGAASSAAGSAPFGYLYCGAVGAGHFVKMVHNGIEYGLMAAYAEGFNLLRHANAGLAGRRIDAETAPLKHPEHFSYELDLAAIAEVWRHGSVVRSWLLDLIGRALEREPGLESFAGQVADSGEGRWTVQAAVEAGVPAPVLATSLFARFTSRGADDFANRVLSALRYEFGGHVERKGEHGR